MCVNKKKKTKTSLKANNEITYNVALELILLNLSVHAETFAQEWSIQNQNLCLDSHNYAMIENRDC